MEENRQVKIMRAARDKIEDGKHWCHGCRARDKDWSKTTPDDPNAIAWSLGGALIWAFGQFTKLPWKEQYPVLRRVARSCAVLMPVLKPRYDRLSKHAPEGGDFSVLHIINTFNDVRLEQMGGELAHEQVIAALDMTIERCKQFGVTAHRDERGAA